MIALAFRRHAHIPPGQLAILLGLGAIGTAIYAHYLYRRSQATLHWRPVDGTIIWSTVEERSTNSRYSSNRDQYRADIKYAYNVGTLQYEGTRVYFGANEWHSSDTAARQLVNRYPPGKKVRVFVDPESAGETVLARGQMQGGQRWAYISAACVVGAVVVFLLRAQLRPYT